MSTELFFITSISGNTTLIPVIPLQYWGLQINILAIIALCFADVCTLPYPIPLASRRPTALSLGLSSYVGGIHCPIYNLPTHIRHGFLLNTI
jgi:hypothetical protein